MSDPLKTENKRNTSPDTPLVDIVFCIALPATILYKLSAVDRLGPLYAFVLALGLAIVYSVYDFAKKRRANAISILGFVSILLTGSFGLMKLDGIWFAVKDAAIPALMGIAVVGSLKTKFPLVRTLLYNDKVIDVAKVEAELKARGTEPAFNRLLVFTTWLLASSFAVSAVLNFYFAYTILKSPSGTPEFNQELGKMTAVSHTVIVVPCMAVMMFTLWRLLTGIKRLTGLDLDTIFKSPPPKIKPDDVKPT